MVHGFNYIRFAEVPLPFPGFRCQDMAGKSVASLDFSGAGLLESLGRSPVGFNFRHLLSSIYL
jgi:hypothetical protein